MPPQTTEAIVLRRQELRETSLILSLFTRDLGKVQGLMKGIRGSRSAVPWIIEPMTLQNVVLYERKRSPFALISGCDLIDGFDPIRRDFDRTSYALFCLDLVDAMTEVSEPEPALYRLLYGTLKAMERARDVRAVVRLFEYTLLQTHGWLPESKNLGLSPGGQLSLQQILDTSIDRIDSLSLTRSVEEELGRVAQRLLDEHIGRRLKTAGFLQQIGLEQDKRQQV